MHAKGLNYATESMSTFSSELELSFLNQLSISSMVWGSCLFFVSGSKKSNKTATLAKPAITRPGAQIATPACRKVCGLQGQYEQLKQQFNTNFTISFKICVTRAAIQIHIIQNLCNWSSSSEPYHLRFI